jgi:hypothetical protein
MNKIAIPNGPVSDADFAGNTSSSIVLDQRPPKTEVDNDFKERHQRRMTAFEKIGRPRAMTETGRECEFATAPVSCRSRQRLTAPRAAIGNLGESQLAAKSSPSSILHIADICAHLTDIIGPYYHHVCGHTTSASRQ